MRAADELAEFYVHTVTVRTLTGGGAWGDEFADPVEVPCFIDHTRALVRNGAGAEVISEATLTCSPQDYQHFTPGTEVDLPDRTATVIKAGLADSGALDLPDHTEVTLT